MRRFRVLLGRGGFTLVEVVIAVGITAATVVTVFALMVPARDGSRRAALTAAAVRLGPALELGLQERGMEEVFGSVSGEGEAAYALYQVRINPSVETSELGPGEIEISAEGTLGDGYSLTSVVRNLSDAEEVAKAEGEMDAVEGPVFVVLLGTDLGEEVQPVKPVGGFADFPSAVLVLDARFHEVPAGLAAAAWVERSQRANARPVLKMPITVRR